jgi:hypothetical protein
MIRSTPEAWVQTFYAGQTLDETWTVYTNAAATAVVDLTGVTGTAVCRTDYTAAGSVVLSFGTANLALGGTAGTLRFQQTAATMAAAGSALGYATAQVVFNCELTEPSGDVSQVLRGVWTIEPEAAR